MPVTPGMAKLICAKHQHAHNLHNLSQARTHHSPCHAGMPITSSVAELIGVELQYAQYQSRTEPIALYFNSQGAQIDMQAVASDTDTYSILDIMGVRARLFRFFWY